jgi:hypothetical protein
MRKLLALSPFVSAERRDLELYFRELEPEIGEIISLDNELSLYGNTTVGDVALRRSPVVKEMVNIKNIIKILNDKDIRICKGTLQRDRYRPPRARACAGPARFEL